MSRLTNDGAIPPPSGAGEGFDLRVVSLDRVHPHEDVDPARVDRLVARLEGEGVLVNPPVVTPSGDAYVLLDGATRFAAFRRLGCAHGVVQVVDEEHLRLERWFHVVREMDRGTLLERLEASPFLAVREGSGEVATLQLGNGREAAVGRRGGASRFAALAALVAAYVGTTTVSRTTNPDVAVAARLYPDLTALVVFPPIGLADVLVAAREHDRLPAGITRFVVSGRVLRLNVDLSLLRGGSDITEKQETLERLLAERERAGRIRRYSEPVFVLDE